MTRNDDYRLSREYERLCKMTEERLGKYFTQNVKQAALLESMRYSLLSGGKRVRSVLALAFCAAAGRDPSIALEAACAVEMLHTYTLIHDDLPCMDDDLYRRGEPSNHIAFGEGVAMLAGDALQASAFQTLLESDCDELPRLKMALELSKAAGALGVCGGQFLDLCDEPKELTEESVLQIHRLKTVPLIECAALLGVISAGGSAAQESAAREYAQALGLAFQVRDDILDIDDRAGKNYARVAGLEQSERLISDLTSRAISVIDGKFGQSELLEYIALRLSERKC